MVIAPWRRAHSSARRTVASGTSSEHTTTSAHAKSASRRSTSATVSARLAPGATAIWLRPSASTTISAVPVAASAVVTIASTPIPSAVSACRTSRPDASSPTQATRRTSAPSRRAATAWLAPLPPRATSSVPSLTVSPGRGSRGSATVKSTLAEPTTRTRGTGGPGTWPGSAGRRRCRRRDSSARRRARRVSPSRPISMCTGSQSTSVGSSATATARGSCSTITDVPGPAHGPKPRRVKAAMRAASGPGRRCSARSSVGARHDRLAGGVQRDQVERQAGGHDARGGVGIDVDVELGRRRHVARHVDGAAHDHDARHARQRGGVRARGPGPRW